MEKQNSLLDVLLEKTEQQARRTAELYKLKVIDKCSNLISGFTARLAITLFITLFFLIFNIGLSLWIGEILGGVYFGFFIVSGFYALGALVLYLFRNRWIKEPLKNAIINEALN